MTVRILLVLLCFPKLLGAEDLDDSELSKALRYQMSDAIVDASNHEYLELTKEQRSDVREKNAVFAGTIDAMLSAVGGIELDANLAAIFLPPNQRPGFEPEFRAEIKRQKNKFEQQLLGELLPFQIELVQRVVLRERLKTGGVRALIESTDLPIVAELKLERSPKTIDSRLNEASKRANDEIHVLKEELQKVAEILRRKASEIRKQELTSALDDLGSDGDNLRRVLLQLDME